MKAYKEYGYIDYIFDKDDEIEIEEIFNDFVDEELNKYDIDEDITREDIIDMYGEDIRQKAENFYIEHYYDDYDNGDDFEYEIERDMKLMGW